MVPDEHMEDIAYIKCYLLHYSGHLPLQIIIQQLRVKIQHYMVDRPNFDEISIDTHN